VYRPGMRKGTIRFCVKPAGSVQKVLLAGDFSGWKPMAMRKQKDGQYVVEVPATKKVSEYKFVVDGQWVTDPDNPAHAPNPYGTTNSLASLEESFGPV